MNNEEPPPPTYASIILRDLKVLIKTNIDDHDERSKLSKRAKELIEELLLLYRAGELNEKEKEQFNQLALSRDFVRLRNFRRQGGRSARRMRRRTHKSRKSHKKGKSRKSRKSHKKGKSRKSRKSHKKGKSRKSHK